MQKGGALLDDMRLLVRNWSGTPLTIAKIHSILGKQTIARSRDTFTRSFRPRFIQGDPPNSWAICKEAENRSVELGDLRNLYYYFTARSELLLYKFSTELLFEKFRLGDWVIGSMEVANWIHRINQERNATWTETIEKKVARGLLAALKDFRILEGRSYKKIVPPSLSPESVSFQAWILKNYCGESGHTIVEHCDWKLFFLSKNNVERLFLEAHQLGYLHYQSAGSTIRIDFPTDDLSRYAKQLFE